MPRLVLWALTGVLAGLGSGGTAFSGGFRNAQERWQLAAKALEVARLAVVAGACAAGVGQLRFCLCCWRRW